MSPRDWAFRVQDILDAIEKIRRFVGGINFEAFENDEELVDAVIHNLTVIGETQISFPPNSPDGILEYHCGRWLIRATSRYMDTGTCVLP